MASTEVKNTNVPKLVQLTVEPEQFNNVIETSTLTSSALEKKVAELFGSVFADFEGCKIVPTGNPGQPDTLKCKLYFKPSMAKTEDGLYAVKVRGENIANKRPKDFSLSDMVNTVNMLSKSKQFELEDIAKEMLAGFLIVPDAKIVDRYNEDLDKVVKVRLPKDWNVYTEEVTDVVGNTRFQNPYLVVNLDLVLIVALMYGKKDIAEIKELAKYGKTPKDRYQYQVNIVKVLNLQTKSFILEIRRIDMNAMNELANSIGYGMMSGSIVMTRR